MLTPSLRLILLASAGLAECRSLLNVEQFHGHFAYKRQNENPSGTILVANAIQTGSSSDGSDKGVSAPGQSKSQTSQDNFINNCSGKTLTNGLQVIEGSCNGIPMGDLPSKKNMVSSIITFPVAGSSDLKADTSFSINVQMINFVPGSFTNAQKTYYAAPQQLSGGNIVGHTHVTVQDLGKSLNPKQPPDATLFVFFKGINDAGNGNGLLSAKVPGGLPAGNYRVCTMASSSNHQPVLMPVAQRGAQDDCTKFTIVTAGSGGNGTASSSAGSAGSSTSVVESSSAIGNFSTSVAASTVGTKAVETSIASTSAVVTSSKAPFGNTTIAATTTRRGGGHGGKGGKPPKATTSKINLTTKAVDISVTTSAPPATSTTSAASNGNGAPASTTTKAANNNGGKGNDGKGGGKNNLGGIKGVKGNGGKGGGKPPKQIIVIVHKITIIRTFFTFVEGSLGGLPPSVGKKGNSFAVLDELFDDLSKACDAACGHQFTTCISFDGPGFEVTKCTEQRNQCGAAASVVTSAPAETPKAITATVTVPPSASVPGEIIGEETVTSTVDAIKTTSVVENHTESGLAPDAVSTVAPNPVKDNAPKPTAKAIEIPSPADGNAACSIFTKTVTVDRPAPTLVTKPLFSNSTGNATLPSAPNAR